MFKKGKIVGVEIRSLEIHVDERGWLAEIFRKDIMEESILPVMSYLSVSHPGIIRGPHEHVAQTDYFCFLGSSDFKVSLWDNREKSLTFQNKVEIVVGETKPVVIIVPEGVVHAYQNIGKQEGLVINCPNQLFMGQGKKEVVDEIRHEDDPKSVFVVDLGNDLRNKEK